MPQRYSKPEVQIAINNSFNQAVNALSITIAEVRDIEAVAEPVRASVRQMFERYKPHHGSGEEEANAPVSPAVRKKFASTGPLRKAYLTD